MEQIEITIYLKRKVRALCKCILSKKEHLDELVNKLNNKEVEVIYLGEVCFNRDEFKYMTIRYLK